jgi:HEPN domain-containing protein
MDIDKQVTYWRQGAERALAVAHELIALDRRSEGLFYLHLALEKVLKGIFCQKVKDFPPRIHNLLRLVELGGIKVTAEQLDLRSRVNDFVMDGRYPDVDMAEPSKESAKDYVGKVEGLFGWLNWQL